MKFDMPLNQTKSHTSQLHLCRPSLANEYSGYDTKQSDGEAPVLGNVEYSFIVITPRSTLAQRVAPDRVLSMSQIELFNI